MTPEQKSEIVQQIFNAAIILGPMIVGWIAVMLKLSIARREALQSVAIAVATVRQTYVAELKALAPDNKLTPELQEKARAKAIEVALSIAPAAASSVIRAWTPEKKDAIVESFVAVSKP